MNERESLDHSSERREMLEAQMSRYLDYADENDDEGGHVGWSRYYRQRAAEIAEELRHVR